MSKLLKEIKETTVGIFSIKEKVSSLQVTLTLTMILCLVLSNIIVVKSIDLFGFSWLANTCSVIVFPLTYILSDVFSEVYGYVWSRKTATWAFLGTALCSGVFALTILLPGNSSWQSQEALVSILGNTPKMLFASLLAFWVGDWANDKVFQIMKNKVNGKNTFIFRAIGSSIVGKYVDGFIFTFIGLSFLPLSTKIIMVINCPFIQVLTETILFPITNIICKKIKKIENIK